jgi:hypothetical protein
MPGADYSRFARSLGACPCLFRGPLLDEKKLRLVVGVLIEAVPLAARPVGSRPMAKTALETTASTRATSAAAWAPDSRNPRERFSCFEGGNNIDHAPAASNSLWRRNGAFSSRPSTLIRMPDENDVQIAKITEANRTVRYGIVGCIIVLGFALIGFGIYLLSQPSWLTLVLAIVGPSGSLVLLYQAHMRYIKKTHKRVVFMEEIIDPSRTSSLDPPDDPPGGKTVEK